MGLQEAMTQMERANGNMFEKLTESDGSEDDEWVEDEDEENICPNVMNNSQDGSEGKLSSGFISANDFLDGGLNYIDDEEDFFDEFERADNPFGEVDVLEHFGKIFNSIPFNKDIGASFNEDEKKAAGNFGMSC